MLNLRIFFIFVELFPHLYRFTQVSSPAIELLFVLLCYKSHPFVRCADAKWMGVTPDYLLAFHKVLRASMLDVWPASMTVRRRK